MKKTTEEHKVDMRKRNEPQSIGDLIDVALRIAEERHALQLQIKEALLSGNDEQLKQSARELVGLK